MATPSQPPRRVIVIGSGFGGIAAVRTYLRLWHAVHSSPPPSSRTPLPPEVLELTVIDAQQSPGGVWAAERLYPGLYAHAPTGLFEFGDASMVEDGVKGRERYSPLSGERVGEYLEGEAGRWGVWAGGEGEGEGKGEESAEGWRDMGEGRRVRGIYGERVVRVTRRGRGGMGREAEGWVVVTRNVGGGLGRKGGEGGEREYECDKLLVATGCYNKPRMPKLSMDDFEGVSIHSSQMGRQFKRLTTDPGIKHVIVVGGAKSAVEACNLFLPHMHPEQLRGRFCVTWVVRPGPKGVNFLLVDLADPSGKVDNTQTRAASLVWASVWDTESFWYWFLHSGRSVLGMWLMAAFWWLLDWSIKRAAGYNKSQNARKLMPEKGRGFEFDLNTVAQLPSKHEAMIELHKDDEEVFRVRRAEVKTLKGRNALIVDARGVEESVPCDAVIWCTGWWPSTDFLDEEEAQRLGVPVAFEEGIEKADEHNTGGFAMTKSAEEKVTEMFPRLRTRRPSDLAPKHTAYTLFRHVVSPWTLANQDRSLSFADMTANANTVVGSETSALWAITWCEGMLDARDVLGLGSDTKIGTDEKASDIEILHASQWATAVQNAFTRLRWGERWSREPEVLLENQAYADQLCRDLGLDPRRKRSLAENSLTEKYRGWKREWFTAYGSADYSQIVDEFVETWKRQGQPRLGSR